jgi:hypothetical protein
MQSRKKPSQPQGGEERTDILFVNRLERLIRMRHDYRDDLNPLGLRLLDRAIYSTFQDCIDFGAGDKARSLMAANPSITLDAEA